MGKLTYLMLAAVAFQIGMMLFLGVGFPGSTLYTLATNPAAWSSIPVIDLILTTIAGIAAAVAIGLYIIKSDFAFYAVLAAVFITFGQVYYEAYQRLVSVLNPWGIPNQITVLIFVPLILPWIFVVLDYIRGRD